MKLSRRNLALSTVVVIFVCLSLGLYWATESTFHSAKAGAEVFELQDPRFVRWTTEAVKALRMAADGPLAPTFQSFDAYEKSYVATYGRPIPKGYDGWFELAKQFDCSLDHSDYARLHSELDEHRAAGGISLQSAALAAALIPSVWLVEVGPHHGIRIPEDQPYPETKALKVKARIIKELSVLAHRLPKTIMLAINLNDEPVILYGGEGQPSSNGPVTADSPLYKLHVLSGKSTSETLLKSCVSAEAREKIEQNKDRHGFLLAPDNFFYTHALLPVFSSSKIDGCFRDLTVPTFYLYNEWTHVNQSQLDAVPWSEKVGGRLFWRGSNSDGHYRSSTPWRSFHRGRLVTMFRSSRLVDARINNYVQCDWLTCMAAFLRYKYVPRLSILDLLRYKFQLNVDGNVLAFRIVNQLRSGSLTFFNSLFTFWGSERIKPWAHYVPYDPSYEDLEAKVAWAMKQDSIAKQVAASARQLAVTRLRKEDMYCYQLRQLLEYADLVK